MKFIRQVKSLCLVLAMLCSFLPVGTHAEEIAEFAMEYEIVPVLLNDEELSGECGTAVNWVLSSDGTLTISGSGSMTDYYSSNRPWQDYLGLITQVIIEDGVTSIGQYAFYDCANLETVSISDSVQSIGLSAFSNCSRLESITLPNGITTIGSFAFDCCESLTALDIPASVTSIGDRAFSYCRELSTITLPEGIKEVASSTFEGCYALTEITIPSGVTTIWEMAFRSCSLSRITFAGKAPKIHGNAFYYVTADAYYPERFGWTEKDFQNYGGTLTWHSYDNGSSGEDEETGVLSSGECGTVVNWVLTSDGVLTISGSGSMADYYSSNRPWQDYLGFITQVIIEDGVTSIGQYAFYDCFNLETVSIPDSVQSIGSSAFMDCIKLKSVSVPSGVTAIMDYTFRGCSKLESVTLPNGITTIGSHAFFFCESLTALDIPASVTSIGNSAFLNCRKFSTITLPEGIKEVAASTFAGCYALTEITIPSSVTTIWEMAFRSCSLSRITFAGKAPKIHGHAFYYVTADAYYPEGFGWTENDFQNYGGTLTWKNYCDHKDEDENHLCDICDDFVSDCIDMDKDIICDICKEVLGMWGDANDDGETNSIDASLILQYDVKLIDETKLNLSVLDVNGDSEVNSIDASLILQYDVKLITSFPVENQK